MLGCTRAGSDECRHSGCAKMYRTFVFLLFLWHFTSIATTASGQSSDPTADAPPADTARPAGHTFPESKWTRENWWQADPFERTRVCNRMAEEVDVEKARAIILAPLPEADTARVQEYLQQRGAVIPPPSGAFFEPKIKLSTTDTRRERKTAPPPAVTDLLLGVPYSAVDEPRNRLFSNMAERGCLLRGLFRLRDLSVPPVLLEAAFFGPTLVFREEITAALADFGPLLVPAFLELSLKEPDREKNPDLYFRTRWARYVLQSTPSGNPRLNLQSAGVDLQKQLMDLYSRLQVAEAIDPILSLADDENEEVRNAARDAIIRYLTTGSLKAKTGTVKSAGGQETTGIIYISARSQAFHAVKQKLEEISRGDYERSNSGEELARQLFALWDRNRLKRFDVELEQALKMAEAGDTDGAVERFRRILAFSPRIAGKERMAPWFLSKARSALEDRDTGEALLYTRLSLLARENPRVEADLYYLMGLREEAAGRPADALMMYRTALAHDPAHAHALAATLTLDPRPRHPVQDDERTALLAALLAALGVLVLLRWRFTRV